jgi:hypothetical protein
MARGGTIARPGRGEEKHEAGKKQPQPREWRIFDATPFGLRPPERFGQLWLIACHQIPLEWRELGQLS